MINLPSSCSLNFDNNNSSLLTTREIVEGGVYVDKTIFVSEWQRKKIIMEFLLSFLDTQHC